MSPRIVHFPAGDIDASWLGRRLTATNRATGRPVTGVLSDFQLFEEPAEVRLWLGGDVVELRPQDTVTHDDLGLMGGAA